MRTKRRACHRRVKDAIGERRRRYRRRRFHRKRDAGVQRRVGMLAIKQSACSIGLMSFRGGLS